MKKLLLILVASAMLGSCGVQKNQTGYIKGDLVEHSGFEKSVKVVGEKLTVPADAIMGAYAVYSLSDSLLLLEYSQRDYMFGVYNLASSDILTYLYREGNGGDEYSIVEYMGQHTVNPDNSVEIIAGDPNLSKVLKTTIKSDGTVKTLDIGNYPQGMYFSPMATDQSEIMFVGSDMIEHKSVLATYDPQADSVIDLNYLSDYKYDTPIGGRALALPAIDPSLSKIALMYSYLNQIAIWDIKTKTAKIFTVADDTMNWDEVKNKDIIGSHRYYEWIEASDDYIFVVYKDPKKNYDSVHVLDWDGEPIVELDLDVSIGRVTYNKNRDQLFVLTPDETLYLYDLDGILS